MVVDLLQHATLDSQHIPRLHANIPSTLVISAILINIYAIMTKFHAYLGFWSHML